jgi:broad specificity phosphatase PhoE
MKVILIHHVDVLPESAHPISPKGEGQADRLGVRLKALDVKPARILHSEKIWTKQTAERIAAKLGVERNVVLAPYPIGAESPVGPFIEDLRKSQADVMMCGHGEFVTRAAAQLLCGDEKRNIVKVRPGHGSLVCLESQGSEWSVIYMWRQDHAPG